MAGVGVGRVGVGVGGNGVGVRMEGVGVGRIGVGVGMEVGAIQPVIGTRVKVSAVPINVD